jgi:hypothetical protein
MPSVYDDGDEGFEQRVRYAATCALRGTDSRHRDTCFEMFDGDEVVEALRRRCLKNPKLHDAVSKVVNPDSFEKTEKKLGHLTRKQLREHARQSRETGSAS